MQNKTVAITAGYISAILTGVSLGLIGGGGSILTVPVLVYLFNLSPTIATSYSLFIVGTSSLVGAYRNYRKVWTDIKTALLFGSSSIATVFLVRKIVVPSIPDILFNIGTAQITKPAATMVLFAALMILASSSMIKSKAPVSNSAKPAPTYKLLLYGVGIGALTGLLGAGGGFLIIPALVFFVGLDMKKAIGTSLLIIALNSLIGFTGDIGQYNTDWKLLTTITSLAISGIFIGGYVGKSIPGNKLKKGFGWFVLIMGIYIIIKETLLQ